MVPKEKVAVTIERDLLARLDRLVLQGRYASRSSAMVQAVEERLEKIERTRLARESAKLDPHFEQTLAEEGLKGERSEWPEYQEVTSIGPI